jgi:DNA-directed RNA polymerase subunit K/omega
MRPRSRYESDKQTEVIARLANRFGKYALVMGVVRRAEDLREAGMARRAHDPLVLIDPWLKSSGGEVVNQAITEIARGDVRIRGAKPGEEVGEG